MSSEWWGKVEDQPMVKKKIYAWVFKKKVYNDNNAKAGTKKCKISTTEKKTYNLKKITFKNIQGKYFLNIM